MSKVRLSNMELLRVIAMFMILVIHANMVSIPKPSYIELAEQPYSVITRYFLESLGICGVNIFVLISGWFTIKTRAKSFLSFFFQILVLLGGVFFLFYVLGKTDLSSLKEVILWTNKHWFIKSYLVLMIIAPILNTFVCHSTEKQIRLIIVGYFIFMCSYGWVGGAKYFYMNGYGPLLFIGLYLLAYYTHYYSKNAPYYIKKFFIFNRNIDLLLYFTFVTINTILGVLLLYLGKNSFSQIYAYVNPFTIIGALYLLLFFSKLNIKTSRVINMMGAGSFAVYLLHTQSESFRFFTYVVRRLYDNYNGILCVSTIFLFLVMVYFAAITIDLPRKWAWTKISNKYQIK